MIAAVTNYCRIRWTTIELYKDRVAFDISDAVTVIRYKTSARPAPLSNSSTCRA